MAKKQITSVQMVGSLVGGVTWIEDGSVFAHHEASDKVARAINSGEAFYVRTSDAREVPVRTKLQHGKYLLIAPDETQPNHLLALPR